MLRSGTPGGATLNLVLFRPTREGKVCDIQLVIIAIVLSTTPIFSKGTDISALFPSNLHYKHPSTQLRLYPALLNGVTRFPSAPMANGFISGIFTRTILYWTLYYTSSVVYRWTVALSSLSARIMTAHSAHHLISLAPCPSHPVHWWNIHKDRKPPPGAWRTSMQNH